MVLLLLHFFTFFFGPKISVAGTRWSGFLQLEHLRRDVGRRRRRRWRRASGPKDLRGLRLKSPSNYFYFARRDFRELGPRNSVSLRNTYFLNRKGFFCFVEHVVYDLIKLSSCSTEFKSYLNIILWDWSRDLFLLKEPGINPKSFRPFTN